MTTYVTECWGERSTVSANWSDAASPVFFNGEHTQYQVSNFRHSAESAMRLMLEKVASEGGDDEDDASDVIDAAIAGMTTLLDSQIDDHSWDAEWDIDGKKYAVDGDEWFAWTDSSDELDQIDATTAVERAFRSGDSGAAAEMWQQHMTSNYSSQESDDWCEVRWLDAVNHSWVLPCFIKSIGDSVVVLWSDTDEAGIADITVTEKDGTAAEQVQKFAEDLGDQLGDLVFE